MAVDAVYAQSAVNIKFDKSKTNPESIVAAISKTGYESWGKNKNMTEIILQSLLPCPSWGHQKLETMPTDACQFFYECEQCKMLLKPKVGDCCVFCSYGSVVCPPMQTGEKSSCCGYNPTD